MAKDTTTPAPSGFYKWVAAGLLAVIMAIIPTTVSLLYAGHGDKIEANTDRIIAMEKLAVDQQELMTKLDKTISIQQARLDWALQPRTTAPVPVP